MIPKLRPSREDEVRRLYRVEVSTAARIEEKYKFTYGGRTFTAQDEGGEVAFSTETSYALQVFMTRGNISASLPPLDLAKGIADLHGIVNPSHISLLQFALSEHDHERLRDVFQREGIYVSQTPTEGKAP